jgi:transposase
MGEFFDPRRPATAFDHATTLVAVLELGRKSWEMGASVPGVSRRPLGRLSAGELAAAIEALERWRAEARGVGRAIVRVVVGYEAGRDGFWIARALKAAWDRGLRHSFGEHRGRMAGTTGEDRPH